MIHVIRFIRDAVKSIAKGLETENKHSHGFTNLVKRSQVDN